MISIIVLRLALAPSMIHHQVSGSGNHRLPGCCVALLAIKMMPATGFWRTGRRAGPATLSLMEVCALQPWDYIAKLMNPPEPEKPGDEPEKAEAKPEKPDDKPEKPGDD